MKRLKPTTFSDSLYAPSRFEVGLLALNPVARKRQCLCYYACSKPDDAGVFIIRGPSCDLPFCGDDESWYFCAAVHEVVPPHDLVHLNKPFTIPAHPFLLN